MISRSALGRRKLTGRNLWFAGLYVTWPTSYEALVGRAELKAGTSCSFIIVLELQSDLYCAGEWLLVTASAGGVGIAACQIGKGALRSSFLP